MTKRKKRVSQSASNAHQRIDDHEKLCRIMQAETNLKIENIHKDVHRIEKILISSAGMLIVGMATLLYKTYFN